MKDRKVKNRRTETKKVFKKTKEEGNDCPPCPDVKQEQTELEPDKTSSALDVLENAAKDRSNNSSSTQTSNSERLKSAKRGGGDQVGAGHLVEVKVNSKMVART